MKFKVLALGLMATTASVASAHVFTSPPEKIRAMPDAKEQSPPPSMALPARVSALPARSTPAADASRPPVPVLFSPRRPFVSGAEAATLSPSAVDAAPPGRMMETEVKGAIEADGYKGVRALTRGPDGVWKARALRGQTEVLLSVGPMGGVSAN